MPAWSLYTTDKYERDFKEYRKKRPDELISVLQNLDRYFAAIETVSHPRQIRAGFIHIEPNGVIAIDQKGGKKRLKLQQTRLYLYCDIDSKTVYLLAIGSKNTQKTDIAACSLFMKNFRTAKGKKNG